MANPIVSAVKGSVAAVALVGNTLVFTLAMVPFALVKLIAPFKPVRRVVDRALNALAAAWVRVNGLWIAAVGHPRWDVRGIEALRRRGWYLVSSNHASWVDILVLQKVFAGHIPFLKFFLKQELIWVPVIGLAWWALDFPFLKRGRGGASGQVDLETTRRACERFRLIPTSVISFVEGTRFTPAKHAAQASPFAHLLKPKAGGMSIALSTMGSQFDALLDVTLFYPDGTPTFWDLLSGRVHRVVVRVQTRPIPPELLDADAQRAPRFRGQVQDWINAMWKDKDRLIGELSREGSTGLERASGAVVEPRSASVNPARPETSGAGGHPVRR